MKSLTEYICESKGTYMTQQEITQILIPIEFWSGDYDIYNDFFNSCSQEDQKYYKNLEKYLDDSYENDKKVLWSKYKGDTRLAALAEYMISREKGMTKIAWKHILERVK